MSKNATTILWWAHLLPCKSFPSSYDPLAIMRQNLKALTIQLSCYKNEECLLTISSFEHLLFCLKRFFSIPANEVQGSLHLDVISQFNFGYLNTWLFSAKLIYKDRWFPKAKCQNEITKLFLKTTKEIKCIKSWDYFVYW